MFLRKLVVATLVVIWMMQGCGNRSEKKVAPTQSTNERLVLDSTDLRKGTHHMRHHEVFGKYVEGINEYVLMGIDEVQASAPGGGGYFADVNAQPPESPVGYDLTFLGKKLLDAPRKTSYCSGATYAAFIEALNFLYRDTRKKLPDAQYEALRMQEPDGSRRNDGVKMWGKWNNNGYGNYDALVAYSGIGKKISPVKARPGDFMNISWKDGGGHSVIFLGWYRDLKDKKHVVYWSSQKRTNGFGNDVVPLSRIAKVVVVRIKKPGKIFSFSPNQEIQHTKGEEIKW